MSLYFTGWAHEPTDFLQMEGGAVYEPRPLSSRPDPAGVRAGGAKSQAVTAGRGLRMSERRGLMLQKETTTPTSPIQSIRRSKPRSDSQDGTFRMPTTTVPVGAKSSRLHACGGGSAANVICNRRGSAPKQQ